MSGSASPERPVTGQLRGRQSMICMEVMANTETWVGLDTNATAGRNEILCRQWGSAVIEIFVIHDSMAAIVARNVVRPNGQGAFVLHALYFVLLTLVLCRNFSRTKYKAQSSKLKVRLRWKGSLIGKAVVLKTTGSLPCRFESCPFRQSY